MIKLKGLLNEGISPNKALWDAFDDWYNANGKPSAYTKQYKWVAQNAQNYGVKSTPVEIARMFNTLADMRKHGRLSCDWKDEKEWMDKRMKR